MSGDFECLRDYVYVSMCGEVWEVDEQSIFIQYIYIHTICICNVIYLMITSCFLNDICHQRIFFHFYTDDFVIVVVLYTCLNVLVFNVCLFNFFFLWIFFYQLLAFIGWWGLLSSLLRFFLLFIVVVAGINIAIVDLILIGSHVFLFV